MTGQPESTLGRAADQAISVAISREACPLNLAPTASTTAMLAMGDAYAMALSEKRGFRRRTSPPSIPGGKLGKKFLKVKDLMRRGDRVPRVASRYAHERGDPRDVRTDDGHHGRGGLGRRAAGAISDGDLRRLLQAHADILTRTAGECARREPKTISEEEFAAAALHRMEEAKITSSSSSDPAGVLTGALHLHDLWGVGLF